MTFSLLNQDGATSIEVVAARKRKGTWGGARKDAGRKPVLKQARSVTFDLEERDLEALRDLAEERGVSVASLVRQALKTLLKRVGKA